jgi:hypothetical protein
VKQPKAGIPDGK